MSKLRTTRPPRSSHGEQNRAFVRSWWFWRWLAVGLIAVVSVLVGSMYAIALWYQHSQTGKPYELGATFIPSYARYLGQDPKATMAALTDELGVRQFRLVSYWNEVEPEQGTYNFSELDWQFAQAEKTGSTVSLSLGLRQPRWPECHAPKWVDTTKPSKDWQPELEEYIAAVVSRYKSSPSLQSYQLENEFFNTFGDCHNFDRQRLADELALVHRVDPSHPVIISRSNNYAGLPLREPQPDIHGISLYRRVYSPWVRGYFTYPFPSWYYAFLAGAQQLTTGKPSIIHELQTEPWPREGASIVDTSLAEQSKTLDAARFRNTVNFAKQTGIRHIDLWGAEYWLYRKDVLRDPSVWNEAKQLYKNPQTYPDS